jgi:hypothetical protein
MRPDGQDDSRQGCGSRDRHNPRPDRSTRFLARVDDHLSALAADSARRAFIDAQIEGWERRYARFIASQGDSEAVADPNEPPSATDFLLTIAGLASRRTAFASHR